MPQARHHNSRSSTTSVTSLSSALLEKIVLFHVLFLLIGTTWAYGGNVYWAKILVGCWGTLSVPLLFFLIRDYRKNHSRLPTAILTLWPFIIFNGIVTISLFFAGFRIGYYEGDALMIRNEVSPWIPSSAIPTISLKALWVFDAIYLSCFNLLLGIKTRHNFRLLLFIFATNAIVLAVFGTLQKMSGSEGLYFGLQPSPQPKFFASFIYHNHWGAFTTLMVALGLGIVFHYLRRNDGGSILKTPAIMVGVSVIFITISVPLSGSRSSSILVLSLLTYALIHWIILNLRRSKSRRGMPKAPIIAGVTVLLVILGASYQMGNKTIHERITDTREQLSDPMVFDGFGSRPILYRDTWRMAQDKILFGWGMGSYPFVFPLYNTSDVSPIDKLPKYFHDAHSDWLQSCAEVGLIGTILLGLCALIPLWHCRHTVFISPISTYLLLGGGLVVLYAWLEFPFGNTAVVIAFWTCFFAALGYGRASSKSIA